jgi:hypothetical protein
MELEPNKKAWIDPFPDSEDVWDTDPIGSSDVAAAIAEAFRRGGRHALATANAA